MFSAPGYEGKPSEHFDGKIFLNEGEAPHGSFWGFVKWRFTREPGPWRDWVDEPPGEPPPPRVEGDRIRATFINHSTVLLQVDGLNILTDPIWSERCSPVGWAGPKRHRDPGIRFEDLPRIHAVLISHNHYDHMDVATLRRLAEEHQSRILMGLGNRAYLEEEAIPGGEDMDWWDSTELDGNWSATFVPAQHFSGRGTNDRNQTLWGGFVVHGKHGAIYFAGDTGDGPHWQQVADRFPNLRLSLLPIGAYRPTEFMSPVHISPEEAVQAHKILNSRVSLGIHFGTFELADDGEEEPVEDLDKALDAAGLSREDFWVLGHGEGRDVPQVGVEPEVTLEGPEEVPDS